jgi:segregation and condensation protein A
MIYTDTDADADVNAGIPLDVNADVNANMNADINTDINTDIDIVIFENKTDNAKSYFIDSLGSSLNESGIDVDSLDFSSFIGNEPIEILVELAKSGKINPWDIDIVDVTDTFFKKIEELQKMDLKISGRTLLYSCVLLRMKSTSLVQGEDTFEEYFDEEDASVEEFDVNEFNMPSLPVRRTARRPVTLKELIEELKKAEKDIIKRKEILRSDKSRRYIDVELTTEDVMDMAHDEAILKRTTTLLAILQNLFKENVFVTLDDIFELEGADRIMDYITLLFLATMKEVVLYQKVIYQTLYIYPYSAAADNKLPELIGELTEAKTAD